MRETGKSQSATYDNDDIADDSQAIGYFIYNMDTQKEEYHSTIQK